MNPEMAIERVLELSAEAHTKRREAAENSPAFHKLTGAILAYGEALNLLTKLRKENARKQEAAKRRWRHSPICFSLQVPS